MGGWALLYVCMGVGGIDRWEWMMDSMLRVCVSVVLIVMVMVDGLDRCGACVYSSGEEILLVGV
jgi:uncharacterized membrane protein YhaH (DUF805 family)